MATIPYRCIVCGKIKHPRRHKYCSDACRDSAERERQQERFAVASPFQGMATGTIGAIGELFVATDLLRKGIDVFRAVSPACLCDLVIHYSGRFYAVEVRSGVRMASGKLHACKPHPSAHIFALVDHNEETIEYRVRPEDKDDLAPLLRLLQFSEQCF